MPPARSSLPRWTAALGVALIWGVNVPVMKIALAALPPFAFNALRLSFSALALVVVDRIENRGHAPAPVPWGTVIGLSLLTSLAYQVLFITGMDRTSASHAGFLIASGPMWTALLARAAGVERVSRRAWVGLAVAFAGTGLVVSATHESGSGTLLGNVLVLLATITWALGTVWSRPVLERFSASRLALLTTLVALPGHWLLAGRSLGPVWSAGLNGGLWAAIVYSGMFSTGLAYGLWNRSVRVLGPARTSAFVNLVPVCALVLAWAFLGERPTAIQLVGGSLILVGLTPWRTTAGYALGESPERAR